MGKLKNPTFSTILLGLFLILSTKTVLKAQTMGTSVVTSDFESWISAGVRLKINKKWAVKVEEELRLMKNSTQIDQYFTSLTGKYKPFKFLEFGLGFRFSQQQEESNIYTPKYRIHLETAYKHKIKRFSFKYRLRYQFTNEIGTTQEEGDYLKHRLRLQAGVQYNIKKIPLEPQFTVELFNQMEKYTLAKFDRLRFVASLAYDFKTFGKLELFYSLEQELFTSYPKTIGIVGLGYVYTINLKKRNKHEK